MIYLNMKIYPMRDDDIWKCGIAGGLLTYVGFWDTWLWDSSILCVDARLCFNGSLNTDLAVYNVGTCSTTTYFYDYRLRVTLHRHM